MRGGKDSWIVNELLGERLITLRVEIMIHFVSAVEYSASRSPSRRAKRNGVELTFVNDVIVAANEVFLCPGRHSKAFLRLASLDIEKCDCLSGER
jgi:hypothetical protein